MYRVLAQYIIHIIFLLKKTLKIANFQKTPFFFLPLIYCLNRLFLNKTLLKKCPNSELLWSPFSRFWSECGKMRARITLNTDTFSEYGHVFLLILILILYLLYTSVYKKRSPAESRILFVQNTIVETLTIVTFIET